MCSSDLGWIPAALKDDETQTDKLLQKLKPVLKIESLREVDVVFIGEPFNEIKPECD